MRVVWTACRRNWRQFLREQFCASHESNGGRWVELMLVALQLSTDEALVALILIIAFLIWALH
jgi:hypothetical protein